MPDSSGQRRDDERRAQHAPFIVACGRRQDKCCGGLNEDRTRTVCLRGEKHGPLPEVAPAATKKRPPPGGAAVAAWWRWRESNPRPKQSSRDIYERSHVFSVAGRTPRDRIRCPASRGS